MVLVIAVLYLVEEEVKYILLGNFKTEIKHQLYLLFITFTKYSPILCLTMLFIHSIRALSALFYHLVQFFGSHDSLHQWICRSFLNRIYFFR